MINRLVSQSLYAAIDKRSDKEIENVVPVTRVNSLGPQSAVDVTKVVTGERCSWNSEKRRVAALALREYHSFGVRLVQPGPAFLVVRSGRAFLCADLADYQFTGQKTRRSRSSATLRRRTMTVLAGVGGSTVRLAMNL